MKASLLLIASVLYVCDTARAQTVHSIAGNGVAGYSGDGGSALSARLNSPWGLAADNAGNLYIADRENNRVRKVDINGVIATVAGTGDMGNAGDGGPASSAQLFRPTGVAVDGVGNLYIADKDNHCIRKITSGIITTIAGNNIPAYSGDGGSATSAQLNSPRGVALDASGNIYIADAGNHVVRKIGIDGIITTIAGNGTPGFSGDGGQAISAQLYGPYHIAIDNNNNVYIADVDNSRIRKVTPTGVISTVAGNGIAVYFGDNGPATSASLQEPISIAVDNDGNLYIADAWNARIRRVNSLGIIETIAGNGIAGYNGDGGAAVNAQLNHPYGITLKGSTLFISDNGNNRIRIMNTKSYNAPQPTQRTVVVYPNPSHGVFTVELNTPDNTPIRLNLIGIDGGKYANFVCMPNWPLTIQPNVPRGIYFITANNREIAPVTLAIQ